MSRLSPHGLSRTGCGTSCRYDDGLKTNTPFLLAARWHLQVCRVFACVHGMCPVVSLPSRCYLHVDALCVPCASHTNGVSYTCQARLHAIAYICYFVRHLHGSRVWLPGCVLVGCDVDMHGITPRDKVRLCTIRCLLCFCNSHGTLFLFLFFTVLASPASYASREAPLAPPLVVS